MCPDEQADPVETAMPSRSRAISRLSASTRSKLILVVFGTRGLRAAVDHRPGHAPEDLFFEAIAQASDAHPFGVELGLRQPGRHSHSHQRRRIFCAGAPASLVLAAGENRLHPGASLDPQGSRPFRPVELVGGEREQVDAHRSHVHWNLPNGLHGVGMNERAMLVSDRGQLGHRLNRADLVVGVHNRNEGGLVRNDGAQSLGIDDARLVDGEQGRPPPAPRECLQRVEHGFVLDRAGNQMLRPVGSSASATPRIAKLSDSVPPLVYTTSEGSALIRAATAARASSRAAFALLSEVVDARGVAELVACRRHDGVDDVWADRGRRVVVEVDAHR